MILEAETVVKRQAYIPDTMRHITAEGEIVERSGWSEQATEIKRNFTYLLNFACLMHSVTPILSHETKDLPFDVLIRKLGCDDATTRKILETYHSLYDYLKDIHVILPADCGKSYGTHLEILWNNYPPSSYCIYIQQWLDDTGHILPNKLERALDDYDKYQ